MDDSHQAYSATRNEVLRSLVDAGFRQYAAVRPSELPRKLVCVFHDRQLRPPRGGSLNVPPSVARIQGVVSLEGSVVGYTGATSYFVVLNGSAESRLIRHSQGTGYRTGRIDVENILIGDDDLIDQYFPVPDSGS